MNMGHKIGSSLSRHNTGNRPGTSASNKGLGSVLSNASGRSNFSGQSSIAE